MSVGRGGAGPAVERELGVRQCLGGVDQPEMAEGLWKVAEELAAGWIHLLGEEAQVSGAVGGPVQHLTCTLDFPGERERMG